jgi:uncharacterized membrane protein YsdA (DUF1294 family)
METFIYFVIGWNLIVFILFGIDKYKAIKDKWRISEKTLILSSFCLGAVGGVLGMIIFSHKTKHLKFKLLLPLAVIVNIAVIYLICSKLF